MVFTTSRKVLLLPMALGAINVLFGGGLILTRAAAGTLKLDFDAAGGAILFAMGLFFAQVAWKLSRYRLEVTDTGLVVGPGKAGDPSRELPWREVDKLVRQEAPARGRRRSNVIYRVQAGKRHLAFTSLLFEDHAELARLIAERTERDWEPA